MSLKRTKKRKALCILNNKTLSNKTIKRNKNPSAPDKSNIKEKLFLISALITSGVSPDTY
jgi:hypothetical protein